MARQTSINWIGFWTIYKKEMDRMFRVPMQTLISPVLTTALYFIVFGSAIGSRITIEGSVTYEQFIVPGLIMMALLINSLTAASSGIYFPKFIGTIYEIFSAPLSYLEITMGYTLAAVTRSMIIAVLIYISALFFTPITVMHPFMAFFFAFATALTFALFGFIIGIWANSFEKLAVLPSLVLTPLSFLGGVFYSLDTLPPFWQKVTLFNPIVYMIDGLRWSFFGEASINPLISVLLISAFLAACIGILWWIFKTGYKIRN